MRDARVPVFNPPQAVASTGRVAGARRWAAIPDVVAPEARPVDAAVPAPDAYPLIVRAPGQHMGRHMLRVDDARDYAQALRALGDRDDLVAAPYVETHSSDGAWRKYRIMTVDGALYPLHLAIAAQWNVHYFSAEMAGRADYRAEETRFLSDPASVLGPRAWTALERLSAALGLDYAGIDFALADDGRIVVFEANAAMTVLHPDDDPRFAYRAAASEAIARAITRMVRRRVAR